MAEEQLEAVLPQPGQVLVEVGQHEAQQLSQVHLEAGDTEQIPSHTPIVFYENLTTDGHTQTSYQLPLHVFIPWRADEDSLLHETNEAPEGVAFILDFGEQWSHQVRHALAVAHVWIKHCIIEQNSPGATKKKKEAKNTLVLCSLYMMEQQHTGVT